MNDGNILMLQFGRQELFELQQWSCNDPRSEPTIFESPEQFLHILHGSLDSDQHTDLLSWISKNTCLEMEHMILSRIIDFYKQQIAYLEMGS